jgi:hypothetical protein
MLNDVIQKIADQTGQPVETVTPIVGALLAHIGDVLPAPLAHQLAIALGVHPDDGSADAATAGTQPAAGGLLGSVMTSLEGGGAASGNFAGATSLMNVASSLLGGYLSSRR